MNLGGDLVPRVDRSLRCCSGLSNTECCTRRPGGRPMLTLLVLWTGSTWPACDALSVSENRNRFCRIPAAPPLPMFLPLK